MQQQDLQADSNSFTAARRAMVEQDLLPRGIRDPRVLAAMGIVPRHEFVDKAWQSVAYEDRSLPIAQGQFMSQPFVVALMVEALQLESGARVLEVGTGSGYAAAVLTCLTPSVYTIERHQALAVSAHERLERLGFPVEVLHGDGTLGWPEAPPYDAIIVAAGSPWIPDVLCRQLAVGGRMIVPLGETHGKQTIKVVERHPDDFTCKPLGTAHFVSLIGDDGWPDRDDESPSIARNH